MFARGGGDFSLKKRESQINNFSFYKKKELNQMHHERCTPVYAKFDSLKLISLEFAFRNIFNLLIFYKFCFSFLLVVNFKK